MKKLKQKKSFKIVFNVIKGIIIFLLVAFVLVVCLQRFSGNKISFFNYRMFTVVSGSMEPKYKIGDVLISRETKASNVKVGDTISYLGDSGNFAGKVITHQVVSIDKDSSGKYVFHAKGLANLVEDPDVNEDQLYGIVIYKSVILSLVYKIVGTKIGFYLFIIIPLIFIIGSEIIATMLEKEDKRRKSIKDKKNKKDSEKESD